MSPKLKNMLQMLCELEKKPRSSIELARDMGLGEATIRRMVRDLRELGCEVTTSGSSHHSRYVLGGWGVFDADKARRLVAQRNDDGI